MMSILYMDILNQLEKGVLRAASYINGQWEVHAEVKEKILEVFRTSPIAVKGGFRDKEAFIHPVHFDQDSGIRMPPGGSSVRRGCFLAKGVVIMPPSYINVGAYVDQDSMIDSHVLVGSCAQIGKRVHLSAGVSVGGVLEPIGSRPVIIEDDVFIGAGSVLVEGVLVKSHAVLGMGVRLSGTLPIYDMVHKTIYRGEVPSRAVVVAGSRGLSGEFAHQHDVSLQCAVIIKYRDEGTEAKVVLENVLRER